MYHLVVLNACMHAFVMISCLMHVLVGMKSVTISQLNVKDLAINIFFILLPSPDDPSLTQAPSLPLARPPVRTSPTAAYITTQRLSSLVTRRRSILPSSRCVDTCTCTIFTSQQLHMYTAKHATGHLLNPHLPTLSMIGALTFSFFLFTVSFPCK